MNSRNLELIARNTSKLLIRNRAYQFFALFSFCCVAYFQIRNQSDLFSDATFSLTTIPWRNLTLPSLPSYMNIYLFVLLQVIPLVLLTISFWDKGRETDSMDAIYYRPESNSEYVWGMSLGFILVFGGTGFLSLILGALIHLLASNTPFILSYYFFYWFTLLLPATVFVVGFSFLVAGLMRNRILTLTVLLIFFIVLIFYVGDTLQGVFDPLGITLPNVFSEMTGHSDLKMYLLQRGAWFFVGVGAICCSVSCFRRIPNTPGKVIQIGGAMTFVLIGLSLGLLFALSNQKNTVLRHLYAATFDKYAFVPKGTLLTQDLIFNPEGERMNVTSEMLVENRTGKFMQEVIFYLNPALRIVSIERGVECLHFEREYQVVRVQQELQPGDSLRLTMSYEGKIDENVCYLDIPDEVIADTRANEYIVCRNGKQYAFLSDDFTLLIPEVLWYPVTVPPVNPSSPYHVDKNFTYYSLRLPTLSNKVVISQGERKQETGYILFRDKLPLDGISLCIGSYETRAIKVDSVVYELHLVKDSPGFPENEEIRFPPGMKLTDFLVNVKADIERRIGRAYPYDRFVMVEVPRTFASYFRNKKGGTEFVQPEMLLLPERDGRFFEEKNFWLPRRLEENMISLLAKKNKVEEPFAWFTQFSLSEGNLEAKLSNIDFCINPYDQSPMFYQHISSLSSGDFPGLDIVLQVISRCYVSNPVGVIVEQIDDKVNREAFDYLSGNSFKDAILDKKLNRDILDRIFTLKSMELNNFLIAEGVPTDRLSEFIFRFMEHSKFRQIELPHLNELFMEEFGFGLMEILPLWYNGNQVPRYIVEDFQVQRVGKKNDWNSSLARVCFSIFNDSDVDGVVNLFSPKSKPSYFSVNGSTGSSDESVPVNLGFKIAAGEGRKVALLFDNTSGTYTLDLNISRNIPNRLSMRLFLSRINTMDTSRYIKTIGRDYFFPKVDEIVVDNEDEGFRVVGTTLASKLGDRVVREHSTVDKYPNLTKWMISNENWRLFIDNNAYGRSVRSAILRLAGKGETSVEWHTRLSREGTYEVFVYLLDPLYSRVLTHNRTLKDNHDPLLQTYLVYSGESEKKVEIPTANRQGWVSLGCFHFTPGEYKVVLSDKGDPQQSIVGDAVKWVHVKK